MPDYILHKGDVIVQQAASISNTTLSNPYLVFGEVINVSDLCDSYSAGDIVLYDSRNQLELQQSSQTYYLIKEKDILFIDDNGT